MASSFPLVLLYFLFLVSVCDFSIKLGIVSVRVDDGKHFLFRFSDSKNVAIDLNFFKGRLNFFREGQFSIHLNPRLRMMFLLKIIQTN